MVEYECDNCGKKFNQKSHWVRHISKKKKPCNVKLKADNIEKMTEKMVKKSTELGVNFCQNSGGSGGSGGIFGLNNLNEYKQDNMILNENLHNNENVRSEQNILLSKYNDMETDINDNIITNLLDKEKQKVGCRFCLRLFSRPDSLKRHLDEERCEVLKLQNQQKENIFVNLLEEEKIVNQTKSELVKLTTNIKNKTDDKSSDKENSEFAQMDYLMAQIKLLNDKMEMQKKESELLIEKQQLKFKKEIERQKYETEHTLKLMTEKCAEIEKNNIELKKTNEKLQFRVNKIVNKNKITNSNNNSNNNITNTIINNPTFKLVNFGSEDLTKISHNVFIDTIRLQGAGLYNKAIEGIYFNKEHPENQNVYISDINRGKVMVYKNEKWIIDNWDNIFPELLEKVIQFGYDKEQFLSDCNYKFDGKKYSRQMIKNGIRWYKLLSDDEPDVDYFTLEPEDRPEIDDDTYNDYVEMQEFRKKHPKKETEVNIKNKIKLNMYNKREIPISNYKQLEIKCVENETKSVLIE